MGISKRKEKYKYRCTSRSRKRGRQGETHLAPRNRFSVVAVTFVFYRIEKAKKGSLV